MDANKPVSREQFDAFGISVICSECIYFAQPGGCDHLKNFKQCEKYATIRAYADQRDAAVERYQSRMSREVAEKVKAAMIEVASGYFGEAVPGKDWKRIIDQFTES